MTKPHPQQPDPVTPGRLTTAEAARRLGVKRQTLYAYVSRGILGREVAADGRSSLFDAAEIDALRQGRGRADEGEMATVVNTAITRVSEDDLQIRGRQLPELARTLSYEAVAEVLWGQSVHHDGAAEGNGREVSRRPPFEPWITPRAQLTAARRLQRLLPTDANGIDRLRATVTLASTHDPLRHDLSEAAVRAAGRSLIALMVDALPTRAETAKARGTSKASKARPPSHDAQPIAERLWPALTRERGRADRRACLDHCLSLLVDHGLATSNFAARLAGSARADPYSVVCAGLGVVGGTLHGASSADVHRILHEAHRSGDVAATVGDARRRLGRHPGFGHRVYQNHDPRFDSLMPALEKAWRGDRRLQTISQVQRMVVKRTGSFANIDAALGALTFLAGMNADAGETIFAIARTAGWLAHALEEYAEAPLRFRIRARYVGI